MSKRICVFCSSATGLDPMFFSESERFCQGLSERGWELIYGASASGLMGHFADEALKRKVPVRGAIPISVKNSGEVMHPGITESVVVNDLMDRKRWMMQESDAFVVFPGGFGTLDEALEVITWKMYGGLNKPIIFLNIKGYWQLQLESYQQMAQAGAIRKEALNEYAVAGSVDELFVYLEKSF